LKKYKNKNKSIKKKMMHRKALPTLYLLLILTSISGHINEYTSSQQATYSLDSEEPLVFIGEEVVIDVSLVNSSGLVRNCKTKYFKNPNNYTLYLEMGSGVLQWDFQDIDFATNIINVEAFDSLNSEIVPILEGTKLWIPSFKVVIPPFYNYSLSLMFETFNAFRRHGLAISTGFGLSGEGPINVIFRLPGNWTVLDHFPKGGTIEQTINFIHVCWNLSGRVDTVFYVKFLPFQTNITDVKIWENPEVVREYSNILHFSSIFPDKGLITLSVDTTYEVSSALVEAWSPYSPYAFVEELPSDIKDLDVLNVYDGIGPCAFDYTLPVPNLIFGNMSGETPGTYRVDYKNKTIIIYPRSHRKEDNNYIFTVRFTISFSTNLEELPFPSFYVGRFFWLYGLPFSDITTYNITKVIMKFVFPSNVQPRVDVCKPKGAKFEIENGNRVVKWVYEAPGDYFCEYYTVYYDIVPLRDGFFVGGIMLTIQLTFLIFVIFVIRRKSDVRRNLTPDAVPWGIRAIVALMGSLPFTYLGIVVGLGVEILRNLYILCLLFSQLLGFVIALLVYLFR
jgi:hypothetical protein